MNTFCRIQTEWARLELTKHLPSVAKEDAVYLIVEKNLINNTNRQAFLEIVAGLEACDFKNAVLKRYLIHMKIKPVFLCNVC